MKGTIEVIPVIKLAIMLVPVLFVTIVLYKWSKDGKNTVYALARMLIQLTLVGYVLTFIFEAKHYTIILGVLTIMLFAASWIALQPIKKNRTRLYSKVLFSIAIGGLITLLLVTQVVLSLDPWFMPRYVVPLGGMIFSNAMNGISLSAERFIAESEKGASYKNARLTAIQASLIPLINSFMAVGIVSFPGMMTGQILSGVEPLIAVRYQIMVMCMVFGSGGISTILFLSLLKSEKGLKSSNNTFVRKAKREDTEGIHNAHMTSIQELCAKDYSQDQINAWGNRTLNQERLESSIENDYIWVVEDFGSIQGYGHLKIWPEKNQAEVMALYLTSKVVGKGFGKIIIHLIKEKTTELGYEKLILSSTKTSKGFYETCGFQQNGPDDCCRIGGVDIEGHPMQIYLTLRSS